MREIKLAAVFVQTNLEIIENYIRARINLAGKWEIPICNVMIKIFL